MVCGLSLDDEDFDFTNLTYWRTRLHKSAPPQRIFDAIRAVVTATGVLQGTHRRALDSMILAGVVATQDTVTQLISAIQKVRLAVPEDGTVPLSTETDEGGKPVIEWSDMVARNALVTGLVNDAEAVLAVARSSSSNEIATDAIGLLGLIAGRDVEP